MTPQFSVFLGTSLDGFLARRNGGLDWLDMVHVPGEDYGYQAFFESVDAILIGSRTYDTVKTFDEWPYGDKPCFVASTRQRVPLRHEVFLNGNPVEIARELDNRDFSRVYLDGGTLIRSFLATGLVSDLTLSVVPILLGGGIPLFREWGKEPLYGEHRLRQDGVKTYPSGLVQLRYVRD